jgi:hypothetical protein
MIQKIPHDPFDGEIKGVSKEDILNKEYDTLKTENIGMKQKLDELTIIKNRMANIIDICELNSHENEKWIIVGT